MMNATTFLSDLRARLPGLKLLTEDLDRESYRRNEAASLDPGLQLAVALPRTTAEVAEIMQTASAHLVPVVPRGGAGTGLSGASGGIAGALTIVFTRMNRIVEIDTQDLVAVVQPGVINADLKAATHKDGLFYAPDPASYEACTIGGNLATNAGACAA